MSLFIDLLSILIFLSSIGIRTYDSKSAPIRCYDVGPDKVFNDPLCLISPIPVGCNAGNQSQECRFCKDTEHKCNFTVTSINLIEETTQIISTKFENEFTSSSFIEKTTYNQLIESQTTQNYIDTTSDILTNPSEIIFNYNHQTTIDDKQTSDSSYSDSSTANHEKYSESQTFETIETTTNKLEMTSTKFETTFQYNELISSEITKETTSLSSSGYTTSTILSSLSTLPLSTQTNINSNMLITGNYFSLDFIKNSFDEFYKNKTFITDLFKNATYNLNGCLNNCSYEGICHFNSKINQYECLCSNIYSGSDCKTSLNACSYLPCMNKGMCVDLTSNQYKCDCGPLFYGNKCQFKINLCQNITCSSNGYCIDVGDGTKCKCHQYYSGEMCEIESSTLKVIKRIIITATISAFIVIGFFIFLILTLDVINYFDGKYSFKTT